MDRTPVTLTIYNIFYKETEENNRESLEISSRKLEIPKEHFMQIWAQ